MSEQGTQFPAAQPAPPNTRTGSPVPGHGDSGTGRSPGLHHGHSRLGWMGAPPFSDRVPNTGNLFAAKERLPWCCRGCRRTRALSCWPCHPRAWSRAAGTAWSWRGGHSLAAPTHQPALLTPIYLQALARGVPHGPDSEHPLTHSISVALHQGHRGRLPAPAPQGAAGERGERGGGFQGRGMWAA